MRRSLTQRDLERSDETAWETMEFDWFIENLQEFAHTDMEMPLTAEIKIFQREGSLHGEG